MSISLDLINREYLEYPKLIKDWGMGMTLCIAAIARKDDGGEVIVTASDHMLSLDDLSMARDTIRPKIMIATRNRRWLMMYAGNPSVALAVLNGAQPLL